MATLTATNYPAARTALANGVSTITVDGSTVTYDLKTLGKMVEEYERENSPATARRRMFGWNLTGFN